MFNADVYFSQQACNITFESGGGNLIQNSWLAKYKKRKIPQTPTILIRGGGVLEDTLFSFTLISLTLDFLIFFFRFLYAP